MKPKLHESRPVDIRKEDQLWKRFHDELRAITVRIDKLKALKRGEVQLNATWIKPTRVHGPVTILEHHGLEVTATTAGF